MGKTIGGHRRWRGGPQRWALTRLRPERAQAAAGGAAWPDVPGGPPEPAPEPAGP